MHTHVDLMVATSPSSHIGPMRKYPTWLTPVQETCTSVHSATGPQAPQTPTDTPCQGVSLRRCRRRLCRSPPSLCGTARRLLWRWRPLASPRRRGGTRRRRRRTSRSCSSRSRHQGAAGSASQIQLSLPWAHVVGQFQGISAHRRMKTAGWRIGMSSRFLVACSTTTMNKSKFGLGSESLSYGGSDMRPTDVETQQSKCKVRGVLEQLYVGFDQIQLGSANVRVGFNHAQGVLDQIWIAYDQN